MKQIGNRCPLTLIEILIVAALIALMGSAATFGINRWVEKVRFRTEVSQFVALLHSAEQTAELFNAELELAIFPNGNEGYQVILTRTTALPEEAAKKFLKRRIFSKIKAVEPLSEGQLILSSRQVAVFMREKQRHVLDQITLVGKYEKHTVLLQKNKSTQGGMQTSYPKALLRSC